MSASPIPSGNEINPRLLASSTRALKALHPTMGSEHLQKMAMSLASLTSIIMDGFQNYQQWMDSVRDLKPFIANQLHAPARQQSPFFVLEDIEAEILAYRNLSPDEPIPEALK